MRVNRACALFDGLTYPLTSEELAGLVGDEEVDLPEGTETVGEVLGRFEADTFGCPEEARLLFLSALGSEAIGRKGYSDRDPPMGLGEAPGPPSF